MLFVYSIFIFIIAKLFRKIWIGFSSIFQSTGTINKKTFCTDLPIFNMYAGNKIEKAIVFSG